VHDKITSKYKNEVYPEDNVAFGALSDATDNMADAREQLGVSGEALVAAGKSHPGVAQYLEDVDKGLEGFKVMGAEG